jgi:hypothetical protein
VLPLQDLPELIDRARESGRAVTIDPPMTRDQIADLESRCGALAADIRDLLAFASGFSVDDVVVNFHGDQPFEFEGMFRCGVPIATDRKGNFWVVDVGAAGKWGAVLFVAHDPPVTILQAGDVAAFLAQVFEARIVDGDAVARIWRENPHVVTRKEALTSPDPVVKAFAEQVGDDFAIADLRDRERGKGFVWGAAGPNAKVLRAGANLLFAIEQEKARLF